MTTKRLLLPLLFSLCAAAFAQDGFRPLFNGKNLDGWDGDPRMWKVQDGMIIGSTEGVEMTDNSFLVSKKSYSDFILKAQMKLRNVNSGIQFRSELVPGKQWVMRGYQFDAGETTYWGNLYEEKSPKRRGIMVNSWAEKGSKVAKLKDWNDVEILCQGDHIQLKLNGVVTADLHDSEKSEGLIGLQLHRGPGMQVYFRDIKIKELK